MRIVLVTLVIALLAATPAHGQDQPPPLGARVVSVEITPPPSNESLYDLVELRVGDAYSPDAVRQTLENIFRLGIYSDVRALWEPSGDGIAMTIELDEIPLVEGITVPDSGPVSRRAVISAARLDQDLRYDMDREAEIAEGINNLYRQHGYWGAEVRLYSMVNLDTNGIRLEISILPGEPTLLRSVTLRGFSVLPDEEVIGIMQEVALQEPFLQDSLQRDLDRITRYYSQNSYYSVDVFAGDPVYESAENVVDLEITVNAGPPINLSFAPEERKGEWKQLVPFQDRNVPLDRIVDNGARNIERRLRERGNIDAKVESTFDFDPVSGEVVISFQVQQGIGFHVGRLDIQGIEPRLVKQIMPQIEMSKKGWFASQIFSNENLQADVQRVLKLLRDEGYRSAILTNRHTERVNESRRVDVTLFFDPGPLSRVSGVSFSGNVTFDAEQLTEAAGLSEGDVLSSANLQNALESLRSFYDAEGFAEVLVAAEVSGTGERMGVEFTIEERQRSLITKIIIAGNESTDESVIRRAITFSEGDPFSRTSLSDSQRALYRLGIFRRVVISSVDEQLTRSDRRVVIRVDESKPYSILYGVGLDSEEKMRFSFSVSNSNVGGRNIETSFSTRVSSLQQRYQLSFRAPRLIQGRIDNFVRLFYEEVQEIGYSARRKGLLLETTGFQWAGWDLTGRYQFKWIDVFDVNPGIYISRFDSSVKLSQLSAVATLDRRDDIVDPSSGFLSNVIVQYSPGWLGSEADFIKGQFQYFHYYRLPVNSVFAAGVRTGLAKPLMGSENLPLSERFGFNGITTLRGFELSELDPAEEATLDFNTIGNALFIGNLELRFPLLQDFGWVVFYDVGAVYPFISDINLHDLIHASGLGLRYATPLGPLRVDYTWDLGSDREKMIFSIGHAF